MRIYVYVDSFNLYYGALRNTTYKWLDLSRLCACLFPRHEIQAIKYFTALVKLRPTDTDKGKPIRQQIYLRALQTLSNVDIIYGSFLSHAVTMKRADGKGYIDVLKTEEKGTDVNIATHLIHDAHNKKFDMAVVISNDSDLVTPIKVVINELGLPVLVVSPYERNSIELKKIATSVRHIRAGVLRVSQFPDTMRDNIGVIKKPDAWRNV